MKSMHIFLVAFLTSAFCFGQSKSLFRIKSVLITDKQQIKESGDFKRKYNSFFEDTTYIVRKTCSGEWGGSVWFKNRKTGIEHSCSATCPVAVNKMGNKYIVTSTLAHLSGFSEIIEISNPDSMSVFKLPEPRERKGDTVFMFVGDNESTSKLGTKILLDSIGVLTLASFPYQGKLYHVITDFKKTYLATILRGRFKIADTISSMSLWTYNPEVIVTNDNHFVVFFENDKAKGYLDIYNNMVNVVIYK